MAALQPDALQLDTLDTCAKELGPLDMNLNINMNKFDATAHLLLTIESRITAVMKSNAKTKTMPVVTVVMVVNSPSMISWQKACIGPTLILGNPSLSDHVGSDET